MKRRPKTGERSDTRSLAKIAEAGWTMLRHRGLPYMTTAKVAKDAPRYVAVKRIPEREDDSTTILFESSYTLEALAKQVVRREEEEAR